MNPALIQLSLAEPQDWLVVADYHTRTRSSRNIVHKPGLLHIGVHGNMLRFDSSQIRSLLQRHLNNLISSDDSNWEDRNIEDLVRWLEFAIVNFEVEGR